MRFGSDADESFRGALPVWAHPDREGLSMSEKHNRAVGVCRIARRVVRTAALAAILASFSLPAWSQQNSADLTEQSLEDLMNIKVTSVSKTEEPLSRTAAAIFVIARDDIVNSGATNIPDLLRMVPGLDVAQIDGNTWAISARGLNGRFSNKLQVLMDGRSVYAPSFGGVFWDVFDLPLEDIERIEVIRGPGGSIWGTNAVNGVINIITRKTSDTHGALVTAGGGNIDQGFGTVEYGGQAGKSTSYRAYTKYLNQGHLPNIAGRDGGDGWHMLRGGFRSDSTLSLKDTLMFQGDIYTAREGTPTSQLPSITAPAPVPVEKIVNLTGGFFQGVWTHTFSPRAETTLQGSYEKYNRNDAVHDNRGTVSLDFQNHFLQGNRQSIVWGLSYSDSNSTSQGSLYGAFTPANLNTQLFNSFIQDEIAIVPSKLYLTAGAQLEHNYYTGFNLMPSARVTWTPSRQHMLWAAVSHAVRSPSELDAGFRSNLSGFSDNNGNQFLVALVGNPKVGNESLIAYEVGYRTSPSPRFSLDLAAYFNHYGNLETTEPIDPFFEFTPAPPHLVLPITFKNLMHGDARGIEIAVNWKVTNRWTLSPGYAFEQINMHLDPTSLDTRSVSQAQGSSPKNAAQLRSHIRLPHGLSWDASAYFVGRLTNPIEPSYTRLDTQLTWQFAEGASLSFVGQNLLRDHHQEFTDVYLSAGTTELKRSAYAKFTWRF